MISRRDFVRSTTAAMILPMAFVKSEANLPFGKPPYIIRIEIEETGKFVLREQLIFNNVLDMMQLDKIFVKNILFQSYCDIVSCVIASKTDNTISHVSYVNAGYSFNTHTQQSEWTRTHNGATENITITTTIGA